MQERVGLAAGRVQAGAGGDVGGDHGHRQGRSRPPERAQQVQAGHGGQVQVGQDQVPPLGAGPVQRDPRVHGVGHLEPAHGGQHVHGEAGGLVVVLDEQDAAAPDGIFGGHAGSVRGYGTVFVAAPVQDGCTLPQKPRIPASTVNPGGSPALAAGR